ncbi:splicing factor 3B subunit 1 [Sarotherodon galilaeus]
MTELNTTLSTAFSKKTPSTLEDSQNARNKRLVISRTRSQLPSNLRVLKSSRRKVIRKEMITRSKEDSRRERSNNFQAFVKMALETLLGSCRRKHGGPRGRQG